MAIRTILRVACYVACSVEENHNGSVKRERISGASREPELHALAAAIRKRREAKGLTQEEAAYEAGVALRTLQNLESGRLNPSYLTLRSVAEALSASLGKLIPD